MKSARQKYLDFLHSDTGYTFAEYLGIVVPRLEVSRANGVSLYRYVRHDYLKTSITGDWRKTKKAAKESYKLKLNASTAWRRILIVTVITAGEDGQPVVADETK